MYRITLHLVLIAVLLGCPFLCFARCPVVTSGPQDSIPHAATGCCGCQHHAPSERPDDSPTPAEDECDCLCNGAVCDSKLVLDLEWTSAAWMGDMADVQAPAIVHGNSAVACGSDRDVQPAGRELRALIASWQC